MFFKRGVLKNFAILTGVLEYSTPVLESLSNKVAGLQVCEIFKNSFFHRAPPMAAFAPNVTNIYVYFLHVFTIT